MEVPLPPPRRPKRPTPHHPIQPAATSKARWVGVVMLVVGALIVVGGSLIVGVIVLVMSTPKKIGPQQSPEQKAVLAFLNDNLHDPKSLEVSAWGKPEPANGAEIKIRDEWVKVDGDTAIYARYRARVPAGGLRLHSSVFVIRNGVVVGNYDSDDFVSAEVVHQIELERKQKEDKIHEISRLEEEARNKERAEAALRVEQIRQEMEKAERERADKSSVDQSKP